MDSACFAPAATKTTAEMDAVTLAALIGSRLCHDLVSPLGAIGNGLELLQMTPETGARAGSPEMALVSEALASAQARIRLFRVAFGMAGEAQRMGRTELDGLIADLTTGTRLSVSVDVEDVDHARGTVKLVLLALMCLATALPWGGVITVAQRGRHWTLEAEAERTRHDPALWAWLGDGSGVQPAPSAGEVHFALLGAAAAEAGRAVRWALTDCGARILF